MSVLLAAKRGCSLARGGGVDVHRNSVLSEPCAPWMSGNEFGKAYHAGLIPCPMGAMHRDSVLLGHRGVAHMGLLAMLIQRRHRRLQPWCPYDRDERSGTAHWCLCLLGLDEPSSEW